MISYDIKQFDVQYTQVLLLISYDIKQFDVQYPQVLLLVSYDIKQFDVQYTQVLLFNTLFNMYCIRNFYYTFITLNRRGDGKRIGSMVTLPRFVC